MAQSTQSRKKSNTGSKSKTGAASKARAKTGAQVQEVSHGREITAVIFAALALLTVIGIFSREGFLVGGMFRFFGGVYGWGLWLLPFVFALAAIVLGFHRDRPAAWRTIAALFTPVVFGAFADLLFFRVEFAAAASFADKVKLLYANGASESGGGVLSGLLYMLGRDALGAWGCGIVLVIAFALLVMAACNTNIIKLIDWFKNRDRADEADKTEEKPSRLKSKATAETEDEAEAPSKRRRAIDIPLDDEPESEKEESLFSRKGRKRKEPVPVSTDAVEPMSVEEAAAIAGVASSVTLSGSGSTAAAVIADPPKKATAAEVTAETAAIANAINSASDTDEYQRPPIYLLKKGHATAASADEELSLNRDRLESTIKSFGVNAKIVNMIHGPTVTRYDLELEQGVKLSRLTNLAGDIALALGVVSVRIAPIPDKISTVGIEVPNKLVSTVYLRDIIDSPKFGASKSKLSFAIGKDIGGEAVVGNISKLPHLLIAGTTGSGKSVCMNSLIISLLYKSDPDDVKLIMIDPKMVELGVYNGIPHLYIPVVTDPKKAAGALQWAVTEMLKRYRLFSELGVRSLASYNEHLESNGQQKIPSVVVVIDELADLMLVASKEVEESICRVAQMGRAAGMHLVIATQRPSADVITGLMKANIPSRIAFAVSSGLESRIILDNVGAEKLVGMGDMLYAPLGCGKPQRVQGAFVSDDERDAIVGFIKEQATANYNEEVMAQIEKAAEEKNSGGKGDSDGEHDPAADYDDLLPQAVDVIFDTKQASVSMLQRRLKLGYSRAARIVDQMEELGVIGPYEGSKPRQIIITREQWMEMQLNSGTAPTEMLKTQMEFADEISSDI